MDLLDIVIIAVIVFCVVDCSSSKSESKRLKEEALKAGQAHLEQDSDGDVKIVLNPPTTAPSSIEKK